MSEQSTGNGPRCLCGSGKHPLSCCGKSDYLFGVPPGNLPKVSKPESQDGPRSASFESIRLKLPKPNLNAVPDATDLRVTRDMIHESQMRIPPFDELDGKLDFLASIKAEIQYSPADDGFRQEFRPKYEFQWILDDPAQLKAMYHSDLKDLRKNVLDCWGRLHGGSPPGPGETEKRNALITVVDSCLSLLRMEISRRRGIEIDEEHQQWLQSQAEKHQERLRTSLCCAAASLIGFGIWFADSRWSLLFSTTLGGVAFLTAGYASGRLGAYLRAFVIPPPPPIRGSLLVFTYTPRFLFDFEMSMVHFTLIATGVGYAAGAMLGYFSGWGLGWYAAAGLPLGAGLIGILSLVRFGDWAKTSLQAGIQLASLAIVGVAMGVLLAPGH